MATEIGYFTPGQADRVWRNALAFEKMASVGAKTDRPITPTPISFVNKSGATIPPYGCIQITGTEETGGRNYLEVKRPFDYAGVMGPFLVNGDREVVADDYGTAQWGPIYRIKTDGTTLAVGTRIGPNASSFEVGKGCLFTCLGDDDIEEDVIRVMACETPLLAVAGAGGIPANGSGTVTAKVPTSGNWTSGSVTYTAYNPFTAVVTANADLILFPIDARWVVVEVC